MYSDRWFEICAISCGKLVFHIDFLKFSLKIAITKKGQAYVCNDKIDKPNLPKMVAVNILRMILSAHEQAESYITVLASLLCYSLPEYVT